MKRLRKLISALSPKDKEAIQKVFKKPTDKVALLYSYLQEEKSFEEIRGLLDISSNALTTLGSRLNEKIQNYLVDIAGSPKEDVLRKLRSIEGILFEEKPTVTIATLKKLERELKRYDLSNELTVVYKHLKKLYLNKSEYFHYSQLYNRHVGYSLALDKAEDILGKYFKEYGVYFAMRDQGRKETLGVIYEEMTNVCSLYQSHRMQINLILMEVMHRLYVDEKAYHRFNLRPLEDVFEEAREILKCYPEDKVYRHLGLIFDQLKFEYYLKHGINDKALQVIEKFLPSVEHLLGHYENYGFPAQLLNGILRLRNNPAIDAVAINKFLLDEDLNIEFLSAPTKLIVYIFNAITAFYEERLKDASKWLFDLVNNVSFKEYPDVFAEVKCITAYIKFYQGDKVLFGQNLSSARRLLRNRKDEGNVHLNAFIKMLTVLESSSDTNRESRLNKQIQILDSVEATGFKPLLFLQPDAKELLKKLN